jgi:protein subunit release factor A|tara:strand:- start:631 stop:837 length:207 start_codon:yes stop_codon:yes gene_type:complete
MTQSNKKSLTSQLRNVESRIQVLSERLYNQDLNNSESKELNKRKKKLIKTREKLKKRLDFNRIEGYNK